MPKLIIQFLWIALLTLVGACYSVVSGLSPKPWIHVDVIPGQIRVGDARVLDVIWVDARSFSEFEDQHIPDAVFYDQTLPSESLAKIFTQWFDRPRPIIVYCADEGCGTSQKVADEIRLNLLEAEVYFLKGGWQAWLQ